jgi:ketosteroid isomerase-like protein
VAHPNENLIRKAYDAFGSGDRDTIEELSADNIAFHVSGRNLLSGDYVGKDQVFGVFDRLAEIFERSFRTELHDILATDEHAVALQPWTAQREGKASLKYGNGHFRVAGVYYPTARPVDGPAGGGRVLGPRCSLHFG